MSFEMQIFSFLFLMLGPFKVVIPFVKITMNASPELTRHIAFRATLFSSAVLLIAAFLGQRIMTSYGIPMSFMALSGGIILFLVALLNVIKQFEPPTGKKDFVTNPTLNMALNPLAFPAIVTPYGIAALIVFLSISPNLNAQLTVGAIVIGIMFLNLIVMLLAKRFFKPLSLTLALLGVILGIIQVALGLMVIINQTKIIFAL
jgi:multiple antibiotic resistance protein